MARRNITKHTLQTLAVPTASLSAHQAQLKQALMASSPPVKNTIKHTWRVLMRKKKIVIPSLATAMVAVALAVGVILQTQLPVSAAEQTQRSISTVSSLSPDERKDLNARVNGDAQKELEAAKKAKDLKVLTYEEYKKQAAQRPGNLGGPNDAAELPRGGRTGAPDMTKLHYLVYTGSDGAHHVIGVDDNDLPVLIMIYRSSPDGGQQGSVMMVDDNGKAGTSAQGDPSTAPISGATQCMQEAGSDKPVCTTTGGAPAPTCTHEADGSTKCSSTVGGGSQQ
jgi:hypothetical protein